MAVLLVSASFLASAATRSVTLAIPTMDCPVCPLTVKRALSKVPGVSHVEVSYEKRQAVVTFDDTKSDVFALTESTKNAGYPSTMVETAK
ncbi:MAG: mercury resistance system periplasmic binding protein MerP [Burkholderiaceae bacterium]